LRWFALALATSTTNRPLSRGERALAVREQLTAMNSTFTTYNKIRSRTD
jgi:hypothetical protein